MIFFNDLICKPTYLVSYNKNQKIYFNSSCEILFILSKKIKLDQQVDVLQRFLYPAPHCVRRSSRNDSRLPCHPERSVSGVEGSHFHPDCYVKNESFDRMNRMRQDWRLKDLNIEKLEDSKIEKKVGNRKSKIIPQNPVPSVPKQPASRWGCFLFLVFLFFLIYCETLARRT